ncbi:ethylbenzene dehydrogenase-related protein, partial [Candidatus Albibeggiatoa sp. nov. BB20]|uniref:ethylbenzene dehydrogenase-related protein n=1 Tax=Candidatus Albibeggiatoa sp. nov. BB20 TaxID=3162723 RepID=UPI0033659185
FKTGDEIGGVVVAPLTGSRGDISAKGIWKDGFWTLEIKRKLVTHEPESIVQDIQFNNLSQSYYFGVTMFDNSQINHLYHKKSIILKFKQ